MVFQVNSWCATGVTLLTSQNLEHCSNSPELAQKCINEIRNFEATAKEFMSTGHKDFRDIFQDSVTPETKPLVSQVIFPAEIRI